MEYNYCNKCGACCKYIAVDWKNKVVFRDGIQPLTDEFAQMLVQVEKRENVTICSCKYLKDNLCSNSNKPDECKDFPSSPFAFLPENCGYEGYIFIKLEKVKQKVRKLKEEILYYEAISKNDKSVKRLIDQHKAAINKYKMYGSEDW